MDEETRQRQQLVNTANQREMARWARDIIRIYNPLNETFKFMWDGYTQTVAAKSTKDIERYLANHYFKKISQRIVGDLIIEKAKELKDKRKSEGQPDYLDKYIENREIWDKTPRLDNPELLAEIKDQVILGLVEEYGVELPDELPSQPQADTRDIYEKILGGKDKRIEDVAPVRELVQEPAVKTKKPLKEEISIE